MSTVRAVQRHLERIAYNCIVAFFALYGLAPHNGHLVTWTLAQTVALLAYIVVLLVYRAPIVAQFDSFSRFKVVMKGGTLLLTHLGILLEALYSRHSMDAMRAGLRSIDRQLTAADIGTTTTTTINSNEANRRSRRNFLLTFIALAVFVGAVEAVTVGIASRPAECQSYWWATAWSLSVARLRHLQHTLFVRALTVRVGSVRRAMGGEETTPYGGGGRRQRLVRLQSIVASVHAVAERMRQVFGLAQLLNLTQNFVQMSCDLYFLYTMLRQGVLNRLNGGLIVSVNTCIQ